MMAIHRAIPAVTPTLLGPGGSIDDMSKSQLIVSSRPVKDMEWRRDGGGLPGVEEMLWLRT